MSRLIDADALIRYIGNSADLGGALGKVVECVKIYAKFMVQTAPTIEERKKGKWILTQDDDYEYCTCSECGYQNGENWMNGSDIPFCAMCGADMRGEDDGQDYTD